MKYQKAVAITREEGGEWLPFEGQGGTVHAIKFENGATWDAVNGWRRIPEMNEMEKSLREDAA